MAANKLQWRRIAKGDKLPCQSFLRKKNGEILKLSTGAGVKVGQDAYYLPVDDVIEEIKNYPIEESEDEKMRRELFERFSHIKGFDWYGLPIKDILAWLDKQGEQKTDKVEPKFKVGDIIKHKERGCICKITAIDTATAEYGVSECNGTHLPFDFQDAWELVEQKSAKWSEKDENHVKSILSTIECCKAQFPNAQSVVEAYNADINWFKSLKERYTWKPSDEQMTALRRMKNAIGGEGEIYEPLNLLYEDLKKLKG